MISAIVCVDENFGIGSNGDLLVHIPEDIQFFKDVTNGNMVIMGRKTYDSLRIKPLPNRINYIITSSVDNKNCLEIRKDYTICANLETAKMMLEDASFTPHDIYIIGGASIYKELLPYCDKAYVTKVHHAYENVDTYFPNIENIKEWEIEYQSEIKEYNNVKYQFYTYRKKV